MFAEAQSLYESLTADMTEAAAGMEANKANYPAYRNQQALYCAARDARYELAKAADPEGLASAEAEQDFQATHALSNSL